MTRDAHHATGWPLCRSWIGILLFCAAFWSAIIYLLTGGANMTTPDHRTPQLAALRSVVMLGNCCALVASDPDAHAPDLRRQYVTGWSEALDALRESDLPADLAGPAGEARQLRLQLANLRGAAMSHVKAINKIGGLSHTDPDTEQRLNQTLHALLRAVQSSLETHRV